jgi:HSP20 family protein
MNPFSTIQRILRPVSDVADDGTVTLRPQHFLQETPEGFRVKVLVPGVAKDGLEVTVSDTLISLKGVRSNLPPKDWTLLFNEELPGDYQLELEHSRAVRADGVTVELKDGVASLFLPKTEELKPRKIPVS